MGRLEFRKAVETDIDSILNIIRHAQAYFKEQGIDQWQNGYPNYETIKSDIDNQYGYVLLKDRDIVATVALIFDGEKSYETIYEGSWISSEEEYATIHRIAVHSDYKGLGLGSIIINKIEDICSSRGINSIRVDTHEDNLSMQRLLYKNGFKYCGIIYLEDNSKRLAFEKLLTRENTINFVENTV